MNNEQFLEAVTVDTAFVPPIERVHAAPRAVGLYVSRMPNRDALAQLRNLLVSQEEENIPPNALDVYLICADAPMRLIGKVELTIHKLHFLQRTLSLFHVEICYVENGVKGPSVQKEELIHTVELSGKSVYDHIG